MNTYTEKLQCRLCQAVLKQAFDLGNMHLTGVFPVAGAERDVPSGPLTVTYCPKCGLVQLGQTYSSYLMYGPSYGYRSSLNNMMIKHLKGVAEEVEKYLLPAPGATIIDIGSNDGTLLKCMSQIFPNTHLVGVDPLARLFIEQDDQYPDHAMTIPKFFSAEALEGVPKAQVITSIAVLYDIDDPIPFAKQVHDALTDDGIWITEQANLNLMLENNAFDSFCQEHLTYYGLDQINFLAESVGLKVIGVSYNDINCGSFRVVLAKEGSHYPRYTGKEPSTSVMELLAIDHIMEGLYDDLRNTLEDLDGSVMGYGASTKGNVLLQFYDLHRGKLPAIVDVNPYKVGRVTPGMGIPIVDEKVMKAMRPDYLLVFPWHFKKGILRREKAFLNRGGKFIFPLPQVEIVE